MLLTNSKKTKGTGEEVVAFIEGGGWWLDLGGALSKKEGHTDHSDARWLENIVLGGDAREC